MYPLYCTTKHVHLLDSILEALAALHSLGLYHGHVTPSRILFSSPSHDERGAATAKLCYLENIKGLAGAWPTDQIISTTPGVNVQEEKDCRWVETFHSYSLRYHWCNKTYQ